MSFFNFDNAFSAEKDSKSMMFSYGDEDEKKGKGTMKSSGFLGFPSHVDFLAMWMSTRKLLRDLSRPRRR